MEKEMWSDYKAEGKAEGDTVDNDRILYLKQYSEYANCITEIMYSKH